MAVGYAVLSRQCSLRNMMLYTSQYCLRDIHPNIPTRKQNHSLFTHILQTLELEIRHLALATKPSRNSSGQT